MAYDNPMIILMTSIDSTNHLEVFWQIKISCLKIPGNKSIVYGTRRPVICKQKDFWDKISNFYSSGHVAVGANSSFPVKLLFNHLGHARPFQGVRIL